MLHFVGDCGLLAETIFATSGRQFICTLWHKLLTFFGCKLVYTALYDSKANGVVERFHRFLTAAFKAHNNPFYLFCNLGWDLLGIRSMVNKDNSYSSSEMLYSTSLRLQREYFNISANSNSRSACIYNLHCFMKRTQPVRARVVTSQPLNYHPDLSSCSYAFDRQSDDKSPLQRP